MFFRKDERKSHSARVILTVGALAAVGAMSLVRCAKQTACVALDKVKGFLKSEKAMCRAKYEDGQN